MAKKDDDKTWSDLLKHWENLTPKERTRLKNLLAKSKGLPRNLTDRERAEFKRLIGKADPVEAATKLVAILNKLWREGRLHLPRRSGS